MCRTKVRSSSVIVVVERAWFQFVSCGLHLIREAGVGIKYFVEEHSTVDNEQVVAGWHVAQCLWVNKIVESGEEGFCCVQCFVYEAGVGSCGVDQWHCTTGIVLTVSLEGDGSGDGCLVGECIDVEAEVIVCEKKTCFQSR